MNLKELLIGSDVFRQREKDYQREVYDKTGVSTLLKKGGLLGLLTNKKRDSRNSSNLQTPGSGKR